jgi:transcriptional pleiotropic regulator of transition state genes
MKKATGMVRKVDELGRVTIPKEIRDVMSIKEKDPMEIFVTDGNIILRKYEPGCIFCGQLNDVTICKGKHIYQECAAEMIKCAG